MAGTKAPHLVKAEIEEYLELEERRKALHREADAECPKRDFLCVEKS